MTDINFKYFRCISYMHDLSSCLLEGYGVLPSSPVNFRFSNLDTSFGILHWEPPATLGETVQDYIVSYQVSNLKDCFTSNLFISSPNSVFYSISNHLILTMSPILFLTLSPILFLTFSPIVFLKILSYSLPNLHSYSLFKQCLVISS